MPFDAGVMAGIVHELKTGALGARIEKVAQPGRDEIVLHLRSKLGSRRLLLSACAGTTRVGFTGIARENPAVPPMFCMLLRKHLTGGFITDIRQIGFDRAIRITVLSSDELGDTSEKSLICEIMGTYSNLLLLDAAGRILSVLHPVSLNASNRRQVLPGFPYENPDPQVGKVDVPDVTREAFLDVLSRDLASGVTTSADKYLLSHYAGLSPLLSREIAFRTAGATNAPVSACDPETLWLNFHRIYDDVFAGRFSPCLLTEKNGKVLDFSFCEIRQYPANVTVTSYPSLSALLDVFYRERDRAESIRYKAQDILRLLTNASGRIEKKTALQKEALEESKSAEKWKLYGDLITAGLYQITRGMTAVSLPNYYDEAMPLVEIPLDGRLTGAQNAQRYYKKYSKAKSASLVLTEQLAESDREKAYLDTVFDSLTKAETENDLSEIRAELALAGYGKKLDNLRRAKGLGKDKAKLKSTFKPMKFIVSGGYTALCGKNNLQNDYVTTKLAGKNDYWFHVKDAPGSHVILLTEGSDDPPAETFTDCAVIALYFSSEREKPLAAVDYAKVRHVHKPAGAKPGFVTYGHHFTAYVTADETRIEALRAKE